MTRKQLLKAKSQIFEGLRTICNLSEKERQEKFYEVFSNCTTKSKNPSKEELKAEYLYSLLVNLVEEALPTN